MSKYNANKIPYAKQDELLDMLCELIIKIKDKSILKDFLKDLLNRQERLMLVRRLLIASYLLQQKTYHEIQKELKVSSGTIARVERWVHFGRDGYKKAIAIKNKS